MNLGDEHAGSLHEKVVFVTGAARGIGRAIADRAVDAGASVFLADINGRAAEAAASELVASGATAWPVHLDVTDHEGAHAAIEHALDIAGRLDVLVNNAGWDTLELFVDSDPATWERVIAINYVGVLNTCHAVVPRFIEQGGGAIVNIGSDAGRVGSSKEAVYAGAKGAVIVFSKTLARELARHGVRVNVVSPGPTETPLMMDELLQGNERHIDALTRAVPLGRMGKPVDIANAVVFLASDDAAFITGQTLSVSGGLTMA